MLTIHSGNSNWNTDGMSTIESCEMETQDYSRSARCEQGKFLQTLACAAASLHFNITAECS